jgi:hypothetical protein
MTDVLVPEPLIVDSLVSEPLVICDYENLSINYFKLCDSRCSAAARFIFLFGLLLLFV